MTSAREGRRRRRRLDERETELVVLACSPLNGGMPSVWMDRVPAAAGTASAGPDVGAGEGPATGTAGACGDENGAGAVAAAGEGSAAAADGCCSGAPGIGIRGI